METITGPPGLVAASADRFVAIVRERLSGATTVHHGHMAEIQVIDGVTASGVWAMDDLVERPGSPFPSFRGYGHYHERYRKMGDRWKIAASRLTRLKAEAVEPR